MNDIANHLNPDMSKSRDCFCDEDLLDSSYEMAEDCIQFVKNAVEEKIKEDKDHEEYLDLLRKHGINTEEFFNE